MQCEGMNYLLLPIYLYPLCHSGIPTGFSPMATIPELPQILNISC